MDRIVVTHEEVSNAQPEIVTSSLEPAAQKNPTPMWSRIACSILVLVLPLLALFTLVLRLAMRNQPAKTRYVWTSYLCTLLVISGLLTSLGFTVAMFRSPVGLAASIGLSDFDEREHFPDLPARSAMTAAELGQRLKPLVIVASPTRRSWFGAEPLVSGVIGAGMLLHADNSGYLFATAGHVVDGEDGKSTAHGPVMISSPTSGWARADVVARNRAVDAALLWVPRHGDGKASFCQATAGPEQYEIGMPVFVIGHPEGLNFTLSTGVISRIPTDELIQISAPVSPGNSGGPVYDAQGELLGVVVGSIDARIAPNAQNLNFAVRADALRNPGDWEFFGNGQGLFSSYYKECSGAKTPLQKGE